MHSSWQHRLEQARRELLTPGYATAPGSCGTTLSSCNVASLSALTTRALTYNTATGVFSGTLTTNTCPHLVAESTFSGVFKSTYSCTFTCGRQTFPAVTGPLAAPLRGQVGYTIRGGMYVYGPNDAGFTPTTAAMPPGICSGPGKMQGFCPAGSNVETCLAYLQYSCGTANAAVGGFASDCGNHASPSHYHTMIACDYNSTAADAHSPLVAVMLDGRGLYGMYEGGGLKPNDLDACGGHYGPVPEVNLANNANEAGDTYYPGAANVYHYHIQSSPPFLLGCFGPVTSLAHGMSLYPASCNPATTTPTNVLRNGNFSQANVVAGTIWSVCTSKGFTKYQIDCPIYSHSFGNGTVQLYNQVTPTADCPVCANCPYPPATSSASPSLTPSVTAAPSVSAAASGGPGSASASSTATTSPNGAASTASPAVSASPSAATPSVSVSSLATASISAAAASALSSSPSPPSEAVVTSASSVSTPASAASPATSLAPPAPLPAGASPSPLPGYINITVALSPAGSADILRSSGAGKALRFAIALAAGLPAGNVAIAFVVTADGSTAFIGTNDPINTASSRRALQAAPAVASKMSVALSVVVPPSMDVNAVLADILSALALAAAPNAPVSSTTSAFSSVVSSWANGTNSTLAQASIGYLSSSTSFPASAAGTAAASSSLGAIVGGVIAGVICVAFIGGVILYVSVYRKKSAVSVAKGTVPSPPSSTARTARTAPTQFAPSPFETANPISQ